MTTKKETKEKQEIKTIDQDNKVVSYIPFGEKDAIELTMGMVRSLIAKPTASGKLPNNKDLINFMMLCKARELNPFTGDAYLTGYDSKDGPTYSLITAKQALDKRAESHPQYNGIESGVILKIGDKIEKREGALFFEDDGEKLVGAYAIAHRKDHEKPHYHDVKFSVYDTGRSRWGKDPGGMIVKVAEAGALRKAFPNQTGGLYLAEEHEAGERNITPGGIKQAGADLLEGEVEVMDEAQEPQKEDAKEPQKDSAAGPPRFKAEVVENIRENLMPPFEITNKELTEYAISDGFTLAKGKSWDMLAQSTLEKFETNWSAIEGKIVDARG